MFVKIIDKKHKVDMTRECDQVEMYPIESDKVGLVLTSQQREPFRLEVTKADYEVYYLNDKGQTIDSYRWAIQKSLAAGDIGPD